ncbi:MAG: flagellar basal body P-ring formation chaperone FlgA [Sulfuritalea sp.]|nr:flagellar basal body P-ring formation chaperone FlgA [Sulfuritalea sp.]
MQLLCHRLQFVAKCFAGFAMGVALAVSAQPAPPQEAPAGEKLLAEVGRWVQQTQQLAPEQFGFAPMDSRVQLQTCDRPLVMDLPFASRETVRVRCLGNPIWQLYMRVVLKPGVSAAAVPAAAASGSNSAVGATTKRKVVVASQLLRAGSLVAVTTLQETEHSGEGLDPQAVGSIKDVENSEMVRDVAAGVPLRSHDVRRAVLVKQGQMVVLSVTQTSGFSITARVEATQDGKIGDKIRLKNPESGRYITGVVTGPSAVRGL